MANYVHTLMGTREIVAKTPQYVVDLQQSLKKPINIFF